MPKLLGEFLQEHQEPFALDIFLAERGFRNRARSFEKGEALPNCAAFAKALFSLLVSQNNCRGEKIKCQERNNGVRECHNLKENQEGRKGQYADDEGEFCSESAGLFNDEKVYEERERKPRSKAEESNKQIRPLSVLEETELYDKGPSPSSFHAKDYKYFIPKTRRESKRLGSSNSFDQYIINKRALHETKRLLTDCAREVIKKQHKRIVGTEELWQLICENVWLWSQDSIQETNTLVLLNYDVLDSEQEWVSPLEMDKEEIGVEIGEAIFEIIINEIFFIK